MLKGNEVIDGGDTIVVGFTLIGRGTLSSVSIIRQGDICIWSNVIQSYWSKYGGWYKPCVASQVYLFQFLLYTSWWDWISILTCSIITGELYPITKIPIVWWRLCGIICRNPDQCVLLRIYGRLWYMCAFLIEPIIVPKDGSDIRNICDGEIINGPSVISREVD